MVNHIEIHVYTDGASRNNPGQSAIGIVFLDGKGDLIAEHKECIGITTNNRAEYLAIIRALELGTEYCRKKVSIFSDSELVINQLNSTYAIKSKELRDLYKQIKINEQFYQEVIYNWVSRKNKHICRADELCNPALEGHYTKK
jgi:ribonuclease HI